MNSNHINMCFVLSIPVVSLSYLPGKRHAEGQAAVTTKRNHSFMAAINHRFIVGHHRLAGECSWQTRAASILLRILLDSWNACVGDVSKSEADEVAL
jgi:hypothetical protein